MKHILCRVVWADNYKSQTEQFFAGNMKYPAKHGTAHELLNFADEKGLAFGFVENKGDRINLKNLGGHTQSFELKGVTVIWCALDPATRRLRVVGWYENAVAYREPQSRKRNAVRGNWTFQFKTEYKNAHLIPTADRYLQVPTKKKVTDKGFIGQRNWFFPEAKPHYKQFMEAFYLMTLGRSHSGLANVADQSTFEEGQRTIAEINMTLRNPKLVATAKAHYGYRCQVCDFSFAERYGALGKEYIEVHHLVPFAGSNKRRGSTVEDVGVLCANCHRMVHRETPPLEISELKKRLR